MGEAARRVAVAASPTATHTAGNKHGEAPEEQPQDGNNNNNNNNSAPTEEDGTETVSHESTASTRTASTANTDQYSSRDDGDDDDDEDNNDADHHHEQQQQQQQDLLVLQTAVDWKVEGNAAFSNKNFQQALEAYQRGLALLVPDHHANIGSQQQQQQYLELNISLQANVAMTLIRLHQFQQAEHVCTSLIQHDSNNINNNNNTTKDLTHTKVWYRRALARQGQASALLPPSSTTTTPSVQQQSKTVAARDLLLAAKSDLQQAMALVEAFASSTCSTTVKERDGLKRTVAILAQQVQQQLLNGDVDDDSAARQKQHAHQAQAQAQGMMQNHVGNNISTTASNGDHNVIVTPPPSNSIRHLQQQHPEPAKQRQDIIRLLLARQMGLQQRQQQAALPGEGFFLIDAHWWTRFCHYVDFFYYQSSSNNNIKNGTTGPLATTTTTTTTNHTITPIQTKLLGYLPPGAILPEIYNDSDNDSSSSSDDDDDSDDDDNMVHNNNHEALLPPPGPIDNTRLLLLPRRPTATRPPLPLAVVGGAEAPENGNVKKRRVTCKTREIFLRHWYRRRPSSSSSSFSNNDNATTMNGGELSQQQQQEQALCPSLVRGYHYEILPREVYSALRQWYGEVTPSLCRRATVLNAAEGDGNARIVVPLYHTVGSIITTASASSSASSSLHQPNNHEEVPPQPSCGSCRAPRVGLRCTRCSVVYYCDRSCQERHWHMHKNECKTIQQYKQQVIEQQQLDSSSSTTMSSPAELLPIADGRVGLNNLGNTCFMNSALQCLSHATPLARLFLSGNFRLDLNVPNPLGTGGKLAHAYEAVMNELWMRDAFGATSAATSRRKSTSPVALKRAIALFAPRFAGHLQHDAQEFLAYLLDGLHEDLNRIRHAPYVEMPDVTDGQNMHVAGARAWNAHRRRNDSLVMDTFYGQFKSTCVCPCCNRVSVSFDSFNHVSLEIPQQNAIVPVGVVVCRAPTGNSTAAMMKPIRYSVQMRRDSPISDLKQELSKLCGIPVSHLHLCKVMDQDILSIYRDNLSVSNLKNLTVAYEAEPFSNAAFASFHVITKHKLVTTSLTSVIAAAEEDNDDAALATAVASSDNDFMGIPILTSFPAESTCRQVFQHFWEIVQDKLPDGEMEHPQDMLQLRMHNGQGQPVALFPNLSAAAATSAASHDAQEGKEQEQNEKSGRTSLIPKDLDEPLVRFLGEAAIDNFLSVWIEWNDTICEDNDCNIDVARFSLVNNHPSWCEAEERMRTIVTRGVTLDQCFETFTKPERLDERNMWYCSNCKEHVRAMKTMELWRLPNILIVHLKRFEFKNVLRRDKLDTLVDFPLEGLDMSNHCASDRDIHFVDQTVPAVYDLFAVTNHYGRMGFGHYTAFAREWSEDGISDDWALFDDSSVRSVGDGNDSVVSPAAYVLFYRRRTFS